MSNQIYEEGFYNGEQKLRFLSQFGEATYNSYKRVLSRAKNLEEPLGKDLYNFNQLEIDQLIEYMAPKTTESVQHSLSIVQYYIRWAIDENLRVNKINPVDSMMSRDYFKRLVNTSARTLFTGEDVFEVVNRLVNFQDKAVVLALFEGINGKKYSELLNLKGRDLDKNSNVVELINEDGSKRVIVISDTLNNILIRAYEEKEYFKKNGNVSENLRTPDKLKLVETPYVIRHSTTNVKSHDQAEGHTISRRLKMVAEFFDMPYFNPSNIRNSGMLYYGMRRYREHGKLTQQDYYDICTQYDTANKDRYAYTYLKRSFLNEENIKELYGEK